jgi:hypothetical protein
LGVKAFLKGLPQEDSMRISLGHVIIVFALLSSGLTAAEEKGQPGAGPEKSQQNSADEAQAKGDLGAAKDSKDSNKINAAEKKLEDAAQSAKDKTNGSAAASGGAEMSASVGPAFVNGSLAVPGASQQMQDTPAKYSAKNAADDKTPTMAWPVPLTDEQKRAIHDRLASAAAPVVPLQAKPSDALPAWVDMQGLVQDLPPDLKEKVPFVSDYKYVNTPDKILLVNPRERIVVGELSK